jgi:hypothetical protein
LPQTTNFEKDVRPGFPKKSIKRGDGRELVTDWYQIGTNLVKVEVGG